MRIFVGNLNRETTTAELRQVFEPYGGYRAKSASCPA